MRQMDESGLSVLAGNERYQVVRQLGSGGMGLVYEVVDLKRGVSVALKTYKYKDSNSLYRLKKEFRSLADLSSPAASANFFGLVRLIFSPPPFVKP